MSTLCARCSASLPALFEGLQTLRCPLCGCVHHTDGEPISPRMLPAYEAIDGDIYRVPGFHVGKASPWMLPSTRPVEDGFYDVRFAGGATHILWWESKRRWFTDGFGEPISQRTLQSWRGAWE